MIKPPHGSRVRTDLIDSSKKDVLIAMLFLCALKSVLFQWFICYLQCSEITVYLVYYGNARNGEAM